MKRELLIQRAEAAKRESKYVDFKSQFDPKNNGDWCEIVKDIVAMANSGGGVIVFGVEDSGAPANTDVSEIQSIDSATMTDKLFRYTGVQFSEFELDQTTRDAKTLPILLVGPSEFPLIFSRPGTYRTEQGKEKIAFQEGSIYFRHGSKSQPGNPDDIRAFIERVVDRVRKSWLSGMRKISLAPPGSTVHVSIDDQMVPDMTGMPAKIVTNHDAPAVQIKHGDENWPYRQKEVIAILNKKLKNHPKISTHDMLCIRRAYNLEDNRPDLAYRPFTKSSTQYSDGFIEWVEGRVREEPGFFQRLRTEFRDKKI